MPNGIDLRERQGASRRFPSDADPRLAPRGSQTSEVSSIELLPHAPLESRGDERGVGTESQPTAWQHALAWARSAIEPRLSLLVALWVVGVVVCSLRPVWGLWTQWRLRRVGLLPVPEAVQRTLSELARRMGLARVVRIAESTLVRVPMVVGYLRPMILLPASVLMGLAPSQLEALLAHELAHVRRHDWLANALQVLAETLFFFHPAVWWLSKRIRDERELCCDDIALSLINDKAVFARTLLILEELRQATPLAAGISMAATGGNLADRVRRLLPANHVAERASRGWLTGAMLLLALGLVGGLSVFAVPRDEKPNAQQTEFADKADEPPKEASPTGDVGNAANAIEQEAAAEGEVGVKGGSESPMKSPSNVENTGGPKPPSVAQESKRADKKIEATDARKRTVRVVDDQKQPIEGAKVRYQFQNGRTIFASLSMFTGWGPKTDKKGEFSEEIPEGADRVIITVKADGFGEFNEDQPASGSSVVAMKPGRVIRVRAVDADQKILKQAVPLLAEHRVWGREFEPQKDGTFKSPSVSLKRKLMRVAAAQDDGPMLFSELIDVATAKPSEDGVLQLTLKPGTRIEGKLDDSVPRPINEGYVELCLVEAEDHKFGSGAWRWNDFTPVKPDGTFVFESVPGGGHAQIHVLVDGDISKKPTVESLKEYMREHKLAEETAIAQQLDDFDYRAMRGLFVTLDQPVVTITVPCEKTASCDFLLLDPSGKPVPNVEVRFNPNGVFTFGRQFNPTGSMYESLLVEGLRKNLTIWIGGDASLPHGREAKQQHEWTDKWISRAKSDADGRVRVRNLPGRGRESFHVEAKDYALPVSPLLNDKDFAKRSLDDDSDRYAVVELAPGETVEKTISLERKQPAVDREFAVIDAKGKPLANVSLSVAELRVGAKEWQTWSTQRFGQLPKGSTDNAGRVVLRIPSQIDTQTVQRLRIGINYESKAGLWLSRQVVEVPLKSDDGVIALLPNSETGRAGKAVYGKLEDLLAKSSPEEWLDLMIKGPNLAVLRKLLASSKVKHPEPIVLLEEGRRGSDEKGSKVKVVNTGDAKFAIVLARARPMNGDLAHESDPNQLPECAFVFDMQGQLIASIGGEIGRTRSNDPDDVDVICLGPEEDWFVRVHKFENNGQFEMQTDYYRLANPVIHAVRYFHYANSNGWSNGPEKITRWGTLYFDFPKLSDKFDSPNHSDDGGPAQTADGVPVIRQLTWDGDRNRFTGAAAQFGKGKPLYEVDLNWSKEFEAVAPKADQLFVAGGEREYDHWHSWQTVVPDKHELLLTITIPQAEGEPKVIEKKLASGKRHIQLQLKPNKDNTSARLELRLDNQEPEVLELPIPLGDRPEKHPPITHILNPGESSRVLNRPLKTSSEALNFEIKLRSTQPVADAKTDN